MKIHNVGTYTFNVYYIFVQAAYLNSFQKYCRYYVGIRTHLCIKREKKKEPCQRPGTQNRKRYRLFFILYTVIPDVFVVRSIYKCRYIYYMGIDKFNEYIREMYIYHRVYLYLRCHRRRRAPCRHRWIYLCLRYTNKWRTLYLFFEVNVYARTIRSVREKGDWYSNEALPCSFTVFVLFLFILLGLIRKHNELILLRAWENSAICTDCMVYIQWTCGPRIKKMNTFFFSRVFFCAFATQFGI